MKTSIEQFTPSYPGKFSRDGNIERERYALFYDFSTLYNGDFHESLKEHLADYDAKAEERQKILKLEHPETRLEFYPPLVQHFIRTCVDDYEFVRYLVYLYANVKTSRSTKDTLETYLVVGPEFTEEDKTLIMTCLKKCCIRSRHFDMSYPYYELFDSLKGILTFASRDRLISDIKDIIKTKPEDDEFYIEYEKEHPYVLISGSDYSDALPERSMIPQEEGAIVNFNCQRAFYLLFQTSGEFVSTGRYYTNPKFYGDRIIFLDIDGVLNSDDYGTEKHEYYNENMIKELGYLVRKTNAKIIVSSSWRGMLQSRIADCQTSYDSILDEFLRLLHQENIYIHGMTPSGHQRGGLTRPLEIRSWLNEYPEIESFVILDDDTFWNWGYLRQNVVTTMRKVSPEEAAERERKRIYPKEYTDGLTRELADKAAEILLRKNEACIMRH